MMKRIWLGLLILLPFLTHGQAIVQPIGAPNVRIRALGTMGGDSGVYIGTRDTLFTPTVQNLIVVRPQDGIAYIFQTHWIPLGEAVWGRIKGNLTDQTDLIDSLNARQRTLVNGYGWVINGGAGTFDSAHVRKVDTMYRLNDSTIAYRINGGTYTALLRGTAAGGINSLVLTVPTVIFSNPITFSNSGGSWTGVLALSTQSANTFLAGPTSGLAAQPTMRLIAIGDLPTGIPNGNLQNSTIGFNLDNTGTVPLFSGSSVALGNTQILHLPYASPTTSGILSSTDYNRFSGGAEPVTSVNGQVGMVSVGNADTLGGYPIDFTNFHNGWVLAVDTIHSKLVFQSPGAGTGITSINGLNAINQTVVVVNGGSGTAPNIQSVTATHTINIPIVSGADSGIATPAMFGRWNALVTDSGFAVFIGNNTTHVPIQKYTSGTNRYIVGDTSASNPGAIVTQSSRQKLSDSIQLLIAAKMTNFGGAPGQLQGTFAAIPAATSYNTGTTYIAQDSGFLYVDTGSGGTRGWKLISSIPQTFNLYLKQGLKPFHNSTDTAAFGGSFTEDDTLDLGYHNLLWLHVQNEATPGSTDSLFIKLNNGKMMVVPAAAFVENNGASTGIKAGTFATRPTASNCQCYYWSTDSLFWSYDNGSWKDLKAGGITVTNTAGTGPATTASGNVLNVDTMRWAHIYNVKDFGAVGDGKRITDGAITSASHTFTSAMAGFTAADVGKIIRVPGAGSSGHDMLTTISAFTNSTTVTLTSAAATTVSSDTVMYGTDNTSFFQAAIFADSLNLGGKVYVPNGVYLFGGPLITSAFGGNPNSQLYFPVAPQGGPGFNRRTHYVIEGETPPNYQPAGFADSLVMLTGTVLYSMIDGSGNLPALFGTASSNAFFNSINYNNFTFRNLTIMVAQNIGNGGPSMGGINGYFMASLGTDNVGVYADGSIARSVKPTNEVAGICYSQKESEIQSVCSNTQVVGFKYGMIFFDGALINNGFAFICQHAFVFPSNAENIQANYLKAFWNINNIYFPNSTICGIIPSGTAYVNITNMQSEVFNAGVWYQYSFIVIDSGNNGHGNIGYTISQAGGTFNNGLYNVFGGSNILSQAIGSPAGTPGLDNVLATNNSSSHTIVLTGEQPNAPSFSAAFETLQPLSALNIMWGDNVLGTGGGSLMKYDTTGQAAWIQLVQGDILGRVAVSGSAGSSITPLNAFSFNVDKSGFIGGNGAAQGSTNGWLNWNTTGQFGVNTAYNSGAAMTLPASTTSVASMLINEGTPPTTTTDRIYAKSSDHNLYWAGSCVSCGATSPVIFSQTASGSAIASGTAATIFGTGTGSLTIAGGTLQVGQKITLHGYVQVSTAGSSPGGLTFSPVIGATGYSFATTPTTSLSNAVYEIELTYTILTTGTSGTCFSVIKVIPNNAVPQMAQSGTLTINTTTSLTLDITGLWGTWVSGDTMNSLPSFTVEVK